jgi:hypothetical protein
VPGRSAAAGRSGARGSGVPRFRPRLHGAEQSAHILIRLVEALILLGDDPDQILDVSAVAVDRRDDRSGCSLVHVR